MTISDLKHCLTFDIDWAPDESIKMCLDALNEFGVKATFFATHFSDFNKEIVLQGYELGIHPNFMHESTHGRSVDEIIEKVLLFLFKIKHWKF